jgi:integral membrane sensor domain MASE1
VRLAVANAGSAVAIYLASQLGLLAGEIGGNVSPLWPPTGVGVAALLIFGLRVLPGIVVAELIIEFSLHIPLLPALVSATGSSLAMVTAFGLLRWVGFRPALDRLRDALTLVLLGAFVAMLVSSTIGTSMRLVAGQVTWSEFWPVWWVWWTGDAMGVLLLTPLLLSLWRFRPAVRRARTVPWYRWVEAAVLLVGAFVVVLVGVRTLGVLFLAFPFIGWAALRFQLAGAAPCALAISLVGIDASMQGYGPFAGQDVLSRMVILQLFNGLVVLGSLLLATIITQFNIARGDIAHTYERLTDVIQHLEDQEPQAPEVEPTRYGHGRKEQDDES